MKNKWRLLLCCYCCVITLNVVSQERDLIDAWFFAGTSYRYSPTSTLQGQLIYLSRRQAFAGYAQAFIQKGKHIIFNPGYLYLGADISGISEHSLINGIFFTAPIGKITIDDRNLIWNRFRKNSNDLHFYRNRLRVSCAYKIGQATGKLYVFDEIFYLFNEGKWTRNRLAAGCSHNIKKWLNLDIVFIRQKDTGGAASIFFITGTIRLN